MVKYTAAYHGTSTAHNKTKDQELKRREVSGVRKIRLPPGDGLASVSATRGCKHWYSTRDAGISTESTMQVHIICGQSEDEIQLAGETAGQLAEQLAMEGMHEMDMHIDKYIKDVG